MALSDIQAGIIQQSYDFFPGANYGIDAAVSSGAPRHLDIDELTTTIPFEAYDRDPSIPATPSRPQTWSGSTEVSNPPALPNATTTGAGWFGAGSTIAGLNFSLQEAVSAAYETATFQRIGTYFDLDRYQQKLTAVGGTRTRGPDLKDTLVRMATLATVRELGRYLVNSPGSSPEMRGLAGYYDGQFGGAGLDPQVQPSTSTNNVNLLIDIRRLLRQLAPSGTGFGQGANALVMSRRTRDAVIRSSIDAGMHLDFRPSGNGDSRLFHLGVPVYLAPVRQDEVEPAAVDPFPEYGGSFHSSIYALRLGGPTGVRVLHSGGDSANYGIQIAELPTAATTSFVNAVVGYHVHGYYALFVPERQACARLFGINIADTMV